MFLTEEENFFPKKELRNVLSCPISDEILQTRLVTLLNVLLIVLLWNVDTKTTTYIFGLQKTTAFSSVTDTNEVYRLTWFVHNLF
jgi:hypothetical protein